MLRAVAVAFVRLARAARALPRHRAALVHGLGGLDVGGVLGAVVGVAHLLVLATRAGGGDRAVVDVTINDNRLDGREPDIMMECYKKGYGANYRNYLPSGEHPVVFACGRDVEIDTAWLCPVTLLVLFQYPEKINLYIPENA